jgi:cysteine desulfurase
MTNHYFDVASTTKMSEGAIERYSYTARNFFANPSSSHSVGKLAHSFLEEQRDTTSSLLDIPIQSVFYTSGASESNAIVLNSLLWKRRKGRIIVSALEHASISQYRVFLEERGFEWVWVKAPHGVVDVEDLNSKITKDTLMIISLLTHNVFGSIQPINTIKEVIAQKEKEFSTSIHFHVDIAQSIGKMKFSITDLGIDSASMSAHKIEGPRGIGLLYLKENSLLKPLSRGGNQEMGMRGGTENLPSISAFNYCLHETITHLDASLSHMKDLHTLLLERIKNIRNVEVLREKKYSYVSSIVTLSSPFIPSQVITRLLDTEGFSVSSASACSNNSQSREHFHPLITGFRPQLLKGAYRISFNHHHTDQDIIDLTVAIENIINTHHM